MGIGRRTAAMFSQAAIAMQIIDPSSLVFIPLSVLSSCVIGFGVRAGFGHSIGASRSQGEGDGTAGWGSWTLCSSTWCESGWRLSLPQGCDPCALSSCERVRAGRRVLRHHPAGALGPFSCRTAPGTKAVQETGVPVTHSCSFDPPTQNTPDAPASAPCVPSPFLPRAHSCACVIRDSGKQEYVVPTGF